jgi:predicted permease
MSTLADDVSRAVRSWRRAPGFAFGAALVLALGIGASVAMFSVVNAVLLGALPVREPGRLLVMWQRDEAGARPMIEVSYPDFLDWRAQGSSFEDMAAFGSVNWSHVLTGAGEPAVLSSAAVSASFFETLGAAPLHGRAFREADDAPGAAQVAVLSYGLWQRRFGRDPAAVGGAITLEGDTDGPERFEVVGVMPRGFDLPRGAELWTPLGRRLATATRALDPAERRGLNVLYVLGRLRPGAGAAEARSDVDAILSRQAEASGVPPSRAVLTPFEDFRLGARTRPALWIASGAVALVLLIACANAAGLLLVRALAREREIAVRLALGASRARVVRQLLVEVGVLVAASAAGAWLVAWACLQALVAFAPAEVPGLQEASLDRAALAATLAIGASSVLLAGLAPALLASRPDLVPSLKVGAGAVGVRGGWRPLRSLVVLETALAAVVLLAAGLLVRSYLRLSGTDLGYQARGVLTVQVDPQPSRYDPSARRRFVVDLLERVRGLPGVVAAGAISARPLKSGPVGWDAAFRLEGQDDVEAARNPFLNWQVVSAGCFRALAIPILDGRDFTMQDDANAPRVVVVGESLARRAWPGRTPLGQRLHSGQRAWTVIGVVPDGRYRELEAARLDIYASQGQAEEEARTLVVRSTARPEPLASLIRAEAAGLDPLVPLGGFLTLEAAVDGALAPWRFNVTLLGLFAALGAVLAAVGLYGVVSHVVTRRRGEIAVRIALGARRRDVVRLVVAQGLGVALAGTGIGLALAFACSSLTARLLYGVAPSDAATYLGIGALLTVVACLASYLPARRAAGIEPLQAFRAE